MLPFRAFLPVPRQPRQIAGSVVLALCAGAAAANDTSPRSWNLSGFGTVGMVHANTDQADFSSSILKATGAGASGRWSGDVDSRLGAQLDVAVAPQWSAVVQLVSEQRPENTYRPQVELANVKYQATPDLTVRVGRVSLPVFMAAEHRNIGYVYSAVRQPVEVSGGVPIDSSDGVDVAWRWRTGDLRHTTSVQYGRTDLGLADGVRLRARGMASLAHSIETGSLSLRASVIGADVNVNLADPLFVALRRFGPAGTMLADRYAIDHKRFSLVSLGADYDPGDWFVAFEGGRQRSQSLLGTTIGLSVGAGYRWRAFTPYIGYSDVRSQGATGTAGLPLAGLPPQLAAQGAALNASLRRLITRLPEQSTASVGTRWDVYTNIALKLQFERVTPRRNSRGTLINAQPGFVSGQTISVTSLSLDFVF